MSSPSSHIPLCAIVFTLIFQVHHVYALTTKIEAGQKECFTEKVDANIPITFQFQVVKGGKMDLDASVEETDGTVVQGWSMEADGRWSKRPKEEKVYAFCFSNKHSKWTPKWVNFNVYTYDHKHIMPSAEELDPIETSIMKLNEDFEELQKQQLFIRSLEKDHRSSVESTSRHLLLWSIFDSLVVLIGGSLQLYFTRRFLNMHT